MSSRRRSQLWRAWGSVLVIGVVATLGTAGPADAQATFLYANSASAQSEQRLYKIDATTGAVVTTCLMQKGNGRGIVVVGNLAYYTVADSNNIFKADLATCADLGVAFSVAGASGLSTIAYDGTNFWVGDYSGTNQAFYYSPSGTLLNTIMLSNCSSYCDGLEFFNGKLISNRGDAIVAPYDVYTTSGVLDTPAFINPNFRATGIAFDGTNFFVSDIFTQKLHVFSGTTGAPIGTMTVTGMHPNASLIEDLSADYAVVLATPVPTLGEWAMIVMAMLLAAGGVAGLHRRRALPRLF